MSSSVIDLIIRIKNGYSSKRENIDAIYTKTNEEIVSLLKKENYIKDYQVKEKNKKKNISIDLLYENGKQALNEVQIVSKSGRRIYSGVKDLKTVLGGLGIAVLTTPRGIMTDKQARKQRVGGEILFKIW